MIERGTTFDLEVPDGWARSEEGGRRVFAGPGGEYLVVSGASVDGAGSQATRLELLDRLLQSGLKAMRSGLEHPSLSTIRPIERDLTMAGLDAWQCAAVAQDGVLLLECVLRGKRGVLLLTLEGPDSTHLSLVFRTVVESVREVESGPGVQAASHH